MRYRLKGGKTKRRSSNKTHNDANDIEVRDFCESRTPMNWTAFLIFIDQVLRLVYERHF